MIQYLASAGVGRLGLVDFDTVEVSNIQRQILHFERDSGIDKIKARIFYTNLVIVLVDIILIFICIII